MKKLTIFFVLLLSFFFVEMSAQQSIRWELTCQGSLEIRVNGVTKVNCTVVGVNANGPTSGVISAEEGEVIEVFGTSTNGTIHPIVVDDDSGMIESARQPYVEYDYYWPEYGITNSYDTFIMPSGIDFYVEIGIN
ncbi:hypothetical protein GCM10008015_02530 [Flavobacterium palustre]|uniref:Uncharacterized protein n=1 Tax=Flavobacterium palustre TaxID=1476463 RepID=A0ABQ1H8J9_9FLAO|nr:hypothetical protein [Flavobacterium palustre]GGA65271.1 hypothetical protein GCM10008015_02530 [Flavobacterium palustre]